MGLTSIEWTGKTWNPIKARLKQDLVLIAKSGAQRVIPAGKIGYHCERLSGGCCKCYACTGNGRTLPAWGTGLDYTVPNREKVEIFLDEKVLLEPLRWRKPTKIFVCSMTDWAADFVPDEMMDRMLAVAALTPWHTYQFLTKRPERIVKLFDRGRDTMGAEDTRQFDLSGCAVTAAARRLLINAREIPADEFTEEDNGRIKRFPWLHASGPMMLWPLPNVQLGFSAEDQPNFDARWEHMRKLAREDWFTWVSLEPLLGPIDCNDALEVWRDHGEILRWAVVGGESGPGARSSNLDWYRNLIQQFADAETPLFVKQAGAKPIGPCQRCHGQGTIITIEDGMPGGAECPEFCYGSRDIPLKLKDKKGGAISEWPAWMRIREFPKLKGATR